MNTRIEEYFIITRDTEDLENEIKMRQCWTGERWSKDIDDVLVYDSFLIAMSDQMDLNYSGSTDLDVPPPGFVLYPADVRKIKESDIKDGWNVLVSARIKKGSAK